MSEHEINGLIEAIEMINRQLKKLEYSKSELNEKLRAALDHKIDGSKSYSTHDYKVTVTTGFNYTLNKDKYEELRYLIPPVFNPVIERKAYDLNKSIILEGEKYANPADMLVISELISKTPKKLYIKIEKKGENDE